MASIEDFRNLKVDGEPAYTVGVSFELGDVTVYRVEGLGLSSQVRSDDPETMQNLLDGHEERVLQRDETQAETQLRWHEDPDHPFTIEDPQAVEQLRVTAQQQREAAA